MKKIYNIISKQQDPRKRRKDYYLIYTLLFLIVAFIVFFTFIINGKSFVWQEDGLWQHYNSLAYFGIWVRDVFRNLLSEHTLEIPLWDFNIGYGSDIITTLNYYAIGDPLNLLTIFVPSAYTEYLYSALVIFRLYLAGVTFSAFCFYKGKGRMPVLAGSLAYVFCGYALYSGIRHPFFLNPMIYLPLLLLGVEKVLQKRKPILFIVMVFVSAISNFYFFYMLVIAVIFYVIARFFTLEHKYRVKEFCNIIFRFLCFGIIGVLLSAVVLLPVILLFRNGLRTEHVVLHPMLYDLTYYQGFITQYFTIEPSKWRILGLAAPTLLGIFTLFSHRKKRKVMKISFIAMIVMLCIPEIGSVMNGFSYVCNRWCFIFAALVCYILVEVWPDMMTLKYRQKRFLILCTGIYYLLLLILDAGETEGTYFGMTIMLLTLAVLIAKDSFFKFCRTLQIVPVCVIGLIILNACVTSHYLYDYKEKGYVSEFVDRGKAISTVKQSSTAAIGKLSDKNGSFGRTDLSMKGVDNSATITEVPTTMFFWSLAKGSTSQYLLDMSMGGWLSNKYQNVASRTFLEALASVKYYVKPASVSSEAGYSLVPYGFKRLETVTTNSKDKERLIEGYEKELGVKELSEEQLNKLGDLINRYTVFENQYALPMGFCYSNYLTHKSYNKMSSIQRQEALLQGILLEDSDIQTMSGKNTEVSPVFTQQYMPYKLECDDYVVQQEDGTFLVAKSKAKVTITFEGAESCETYLMISGLEAEAITNLELYQDEEGSLFPQTVYNEMSSLEKNNLWRADLYASDWDKRRFDISVSSNSASGSILYGNSYYEWGIGQEDFLVNLGYQEEACTEIEITFPYAGEYHFDELNVICQPMDNYVTQIEALKEDVLENEEIGINYVKGMINLNSDKILCLTIPYDKGWTAYVDGVETELLQANVMYMALPLSEGEHKIELRYQTCGLKEGAILSVCGVAFFAIVVVRKKKSLKNTNQ